VRPAVANASAANNTSPTFINTECAQYLPLLDGYPWNHQIAYAVMQAEDTSCSPVATNTANKNGTVDRGLLQVNSIHADMVDDNLNALYNPLTNVAVAYKVYTAKQQETGNGWTAWSAYDNGRYKKFM
jgi:hypothetical protein